MKKAITAVMALSAMVSCTTSNESKVLVLYYSQTGSTATVAQEIAARTGADIATFDVEEAYNGTYAETIARCQAEMAEGKLSKLQPLGVDLSKYDVIFVGYPIWFGTCARPALSLFGEVDFSGKTLVPFCTFGSGGLNTSTADIKAFFPELDIREGYGVRTARVAKAPAELERFLIEGGFIEGEIEALPEFSEVAPVTEVEAAIFDAACSSYQMPLGTPVAFASRAIPEGTEYRFEAQSAGPDGVAAKSQIFVILSNEEGVPAEFTQVVR